MSIWFENRFLDDKGLHLHDTHTNMTRHCHDINETKLKLAPNKKKQTRNLVNTDSAFIPWQQQSNDRWNLPGLLHAGFHMHYFQYFSGTFYIKTKIFLDPGGNSLTFMTEVIMYIFGVWNLGKTNIFRVWDFEDWKKYLGSKIDGKLM